MKNNSTKIKIFPHFCYSFGAVSMARTSPNLKENNDLLITSLKFPLTITLKAFTSHNPAKFKIQRLLWNHYKKV